MDPLTAIDIEALNELAATVIEERRRLAAAKALGRKAVGVEIEERYCEIAARRLRQEVMGFGGTA